MIDEALTAAVLATVWTWSVNSKKVVRLAMTGSVSSLPLWAVSRAGYVALSVVNVALLIGQFGLPVAAFFLFAWDSAIFVVIVGIGMGLILGPILDLLVGRPLMLRYFLSALLAGIAMAALVAAM